APIADQGSRTEPSVGDESSPRPANTPPVATSGSGGVPRRFSGGLPSWLLAEAGTEAPSAEAAPAEAESLRAPAAEQSEPERHHRHNDVDLNEDQVAALAADLVEAKHEEAAAEAEADTVVGGAVFEEEDTEEETEAAEEVQEVHSENTSGLSAEDVAEVEARRAADRADFAADMAQENAEHVAALGEHHEPHEVGHEEEQEEQESELAHAESEEAR